MVASGEVGLRYELELWHPVSERISRRRLGVDVNVSASRSGYVALVPIDFLDHKNRITCNSN